MSEQGRGVFVPAGYDTLVGEHGAARASPPRPAGPFLQQVDQKIPSLVQGLVKASYQQDLTTLTLEAWMDGSVQPLAIRTVSGGITPAQPLLVIVTQDQPVEVEALLEHQDSGFVHPGQSVTVKVETFTYTKYGTLDGTLISVSRDAIEDEKRGLICSSKIRLDCDHLNTNGQDIKLLPGMAVTVEVKTDQRRVIEYFLSSLQQYAGESIREY